MATAPPESEVRSTFARRLREEQARHGWSTDRLAAESGVSARTVGRYRAGARAPRLRNLLLLASALGVNPASLLTDEDSR